MSFMFEPEGKPLEDQLLKILEPRLGRVFGKFVSLLLQFIVFIILVPIVGGLALFGSILLIGLVGVWIKVIAEITTFLLDLFGIPHEKHF